ncbi:MAG: TIGR00730 family Rossman fold protein [Candidatus Dadabacteria bacterium]|nr:TIGR00730 family Rossman fold protein [Candidatus Dadabacteria bacterium]NIQ15665.1 TIGR00730 family Rossman fold protein [Candidatus Dadabacteria bacterium]
MEDKTDKLTEKQIEEEIEEEIEKKEDTFFIKGPHSRTSEFWQTLKVLGEFIKGFRTLHFVGPCVTVFGSARVTEDNQYYKIARNIGRDLAEIGLTIMTGGGPGIMEAANRGAKDAGGRSIGCNIILPHEQAPNKYLDHCVSFHYFFVRKVMLFKYSYAFIVLPGGVGTMDEFFEAITLIQNKKIFSFPLVLYGKEYFKPLSNFLNNMVEDGMIDNEDIDLILFTDSAEEAVEHIRIHAVDKFKLNLQKIPKPSIVLGESE